MVCNYFKHKDVVNSEVNKNTLSLENYDISQDEIQLRRTVGNDEIERKFLTEKNNSMKAIKLMDPVITPIKKTKNNRKEEDLKTHHPFRDVLYLIK